MRNFFTTFMFVVFLFSLQLITPQAANAARPDVLISQDVGSGNQININIEFSDHWGKRQRAELRGSRGASKAEEVCVFRGSSERCLSTKASYETIKKEILTYKKDHKASLTGICAVIKKQYGTLIDTSPPSVRKLLNEGKRAYTNFASNCINAIADNWPDQRYASAIKPLVSNKTASLEDTAKPTKQTASDQEVSSIIRCDETSGTVTSNQTILKDLGFYTSTVDGLVGPNYRRAVAAAKQLLGIHADANMECLNPSDRQILSTINVAGDKGSECINLLSANQMKSIFQKMQSSDLTKKLELNYDSTSGLIWMIDTISDLEQRLSLTDFYQSNKSSYRDCKLDDIELTALSPRPPVNISLLANTLSLNFLARNDGTSLRLVATGDDLETSRMSKSVFGGVNQASMDISFSTINGRSVLDFIISELETKINLHFYASKSENANLTDQIRELYLDEAPGGRSAFKIRMFEDGTTNVQTGEFAKLVTKMPDNDKALIAALCSEVGKLSRSAKLFEASFNTPEDRSLFQSSDFSSQPVLNAVSLLANQCIDEVRAKGRVTSSFKIEKITPVCTDRQLETLAKLEADINAYKKSTQDTRDEIIDVQVERSDVDFLQCDAYESELIAVEKVLVDKDLKIATANETLTTLIAEVNEGQELLERLKKIEQTLGLCIGENTELKDRIDNFIKSHDPTYVAVVCGDGAAQNPIQTVIDEINATISVLAEKHISGDEISELQSQIAQLKQQREDLEVVLTSSTALKVSPLKFEEQVRLNEALRDTVADVEFQVSALENEISNLRNIMDDNTPLILEIDMLNQKLVEFTSEKQSVQDNLKIVKSQVQNSQAQVAVRENNMEKIKLQVQDLETQLDAASSTSRSLQDEVEALNRDIDTKQVNVEALKKESTRVQTLIADANSIIAQNSQEIAELDTSLSKKKTELANLSNLEGTLSPQAAAAEQTVLDLEQSLMKDFVPIKQFEEKNTQLSDLTQIVTERTNLIRELRADLEAIYSEEQSLLKMCVSDPQCKEAMGGRLGDE